MSSDSDSFYPNHIEAIERYLRLLKTHLSATEREFIKRRLAQEQQSLQTHTFVARANIDHFLDLLNEDDLSSERRAVIIKLLIAEGDRLSHDLEQLQFAEGRAAKGRDRLNHLRQLLAGANQADRARAERRIADAEILQDALDGFCERLRMKVNARI